MKWLECSVEMTFIESEPLGGVFSNDQMTIMLKLSILLDDVNIIRKDQV